MFMGNMCPVIGSDCITTVYCVESLSLVLLVLLAFHPRIILM